MKTLHILRKSENPLAMEAIEHEEQHRQVAVLLIQDGVLARGNFPDETYLCQEDVIARGIQNRYLPVDYPAIARLIVQFDRIITW
jgi:sulfur relay protein TusB/DsrH